MAAIVEGNTRGNPVSVVLRRAGERVAGLGRWLGGTLRIMSRNKVGFIGFLIVVAMTVIAYLGPVFWPFDPKADPTMIYKTPSAAHWLGTDSQGRDVLRQILNGGASLLSVGYLAAAITTVIGVAIGALAAYLGGTVDAVLSWLSDVFLTIPQFALLAVLAGIVHLNGTWPVALLIGAFGWPVLMRSIRAQVLSLRGREYVEAARMLDMPTRYIVFHEIAPGMAGFIATSFVLNVTAAMYASVGLIFLGIVPIAGVNWGVMLNLAWAQGAIFFHDSIWYILSPMIAIVLFQLALLSMSRAVSEVFDPRLRE
ncbi:MAG TPA: ABC transporter permease [Thermomicrobiales bacterium]|nr:ABC transporter permease [Thermomicrobiales bacterium]